MLVNTARPRVFVLGLCLLVVYAVQWVEVLFDGVPGGAPHLVDEVDDSNQEKQEDTGQGGKPDDHMEEVVVLIT